MVMKIQKAGEKDYFEGDFFSFSKEQSAEKTFLIRRKRRKGAKRRENKSKKTSTVVTSKQFR